MVECDMKPSELSQIEPNTFRHIGRESISMLMLWFYVFLRILFPRHTNNFETKYYDIKKKEISYILTIFSDGSQ
jgi:hypothetical protein